VKCAVCTTRFQQPARGRRRKFCSDACKARAARRRVKLAERAPRVEGDAFRDVPKLRNAVVPLTLAQANAGVAKWHRTHAPLRFHRFSVGVTNASGELCGVAICARPSSATLDQWTTLEVARLATDGTLNACSKLLGACARAAKAMGYQRVITYILDSERGTSLRAAGWTMDYRNGKPSRPRDHGRPSDATPRIRSDELLQPKQRWSKDLH
jgi:hypothetical protein